MSNPCRYTEANKVGLFQLACLIWEQYELSGKCRYNLAGLFWYLQPEVYDAYLTIGKHVANCPDSTRVSGFSESEDLKEDLEAVEAKIVKGEAVSEDAGHRRIKEEFAKIKTAVETFRSKCTNKILVEEITPWLNSLYDVATAGEAAMQAVLLWKRQMWTALGRSGCRGKSNGNTGCVSCLCWR